MFDSPKPTITFEDTQAKMALQSSEGLTIREWVKLEEYGRDHNKLHDLYRVYKAQHLGIFVHDKPVIQAQVLVCAAQMFYHRGFALNQDAQQRASGFQSAVEALMYPLILPWRWLF